MATKWVKAELPENLVDALETIAKAHDETPAQALARAIATMQFLEEQEKKGSRMLLDRADGLEEVRIRR